MNTKQIDDYLLKDPVKESEIGYDSSIWDQVVGYVKQIGYDEDTMNQSVAKQNMGLLQRKDYAPVLDEDYHRRTYAYHTSYKTAEGFEKESSFICR
jgi:hypothetical protein